MPEALKHIYSTSFVSRLSRALKKHYPAFNSRQFSRSVFCDEWQDKELKDRMRHIAKCMGEHLPSSYKKSLSILKPVSTQFTDLEAMIFPDFVEVFGLDDLDASLPALEHFTQFSSSEFAVRPFIIRYQTKMMRQMKAWAKSDNHHVRRLASEGCRPRLPWAMSLPEFKQDPKHVIPILELLKQDESEYVRRSVANNLNDISKDHPTTVIKIAKLWSSRHADTDKLIKHACRTLLKQGHTPALRLFGFKKPSHISISKFKLDKTVSMGKALEFTFQISTTAKTPTSSLGKLRLEYAIDFFKANGQLSRKVFMISESQLSAPTKEVCKRHSFKAISTRKYYAGKHGLAIIINGVEISHKSFTLK